MKSFMRFSQLLAALLVSGVFALPASATPVTFQFEAVVDSLAIGIPFESGVEFALGDTLSGQFTFEPQIAHGEQLLEVTQPFGVKVLVDGYSFSTSASANELVLSSYNDNGISDFPPADFIDIIEMYSAIGPVDHDLLPNIDGDRSFFRTQLYGNTSILEAPGFPAEIGAWNSFQYIRSLTLGIRGKQGGIIGFSATVGSFYIIPEPSTLLLVVSSLILVFTPRIYGNDKERSMTMFKNNQIAKRKNANTHLGFEKLEDRRLLTINWVNEFATEADSPNFELWYGPDETVARAIVNRAIDDWEAVITDFNYYDTSLNNTFSLTVSA